MSHTLLMSLHLSPLTWQVNVLQCRIACTVKELFKEISSNKKNEKVASCTEPLKQPKPQRDRSSQTRYILFSSLTFKPHVLSQESWLVVIKRKHR